MEVFYNLDNLSGLKNAVVTIGSFDGVHLGHKTLIEQITHLAKEHNGNSVVITFEPHPRLILEKNPVNFGLLTSLDEKIKLIGECGVDYMIIVPFDLIFAHQSAESYLNDFLVQKIKPKTIVVGYDHRYGEGRQGDFALMKKVMEPLGIHVIEINPKLIDEITISSTNIRKALKEGDLPKVNAFLGYEYLILGKVGHGDKIGRTLNFPTANLILQESHKALPLDGIYLSKIKVHEIEYFGLTYIGKRPVVGVELSKVVEVYIYDFDENIYDLDIEVRLIELIREDEDVEDFDALRKKMESDKVKGRAMIAKLTASKLKDIAVVVLNYNGVNHLKNYLPELIKYSPEAEIVVADNASTDGSLDYLNEFDGHITVIKLDSNYGFTGGYNRAIAQLNHTFILLLNSDVRVTPNWLLPLISRMKSDDYIGAIQPKMLNDRNPEYFDYAGASGGWIDILGYPYCRGRIFDTIERDQSQYNNCEEVFWASGAAFLTRSELYKKLGGLDDDFFAHMEEIDLCWRMKNLGYKVLVEPASSVYHYGGGTLDATSPYKTYLNFRNSLFVLLKNEKEFVFCKIFARLILDGVAGIRFLAQGKISFVYAILKAHLHFYTRMKLFLNKRRENIKMYKSHQFNNKGRISQLIIWQYFVKKKKFFSEL